MAPRSMWKKLLPAAGSANASGTGTAGAIAVWKSATELRFLAVDLEPGPASAGFFFCLGSPLLRVAQRTQHRFAGPAIHLQSRRLLVCTERRPRLHPGLAVYLVAVKTDARELTLHRFHVCAAQLGRGRPWRRKRPRAQNAVAEMAYNMHIQIGTSLFLDHEVLPGRPKRRPADPFRLHQRGRLRLVGRAQLV